MILTPSKKHDLPPRHLLFSSGFRFSLCRPRRRLVERVATGMSGVLGDLWFAWGFSEFTEGIQRWLDEHTPDGASGDMADGDIAWDLQGCCNTEESIFLGFYGGYIIAFFLLYSTTLLKPMRLLAVFVHEFGHASICWLTGGTVKKIEVYHNEGGVTAYTGGCR